MQTVKLFSHSFELTELEYCLFFLISQPPNFIGMQLDPCTIITLKCPYIVLSKTKLGFSFSTIQRPT